MPPPGRSRPSSSQLARNDRAELQGPAADRLVGNIDATLGEHILDVTVAQSEAEVEPDGLLDDDARSGGGGMTAYPLANAIRSVRTKPACYRDSASLMHREDTVAHSDAAS
jgi:hypothetical protein